MSTARNGVVSQDALEVEGPHATYATGPRIHAPRTQSGTSARSRIHRREAYLVSVAAGLAAIGVCVASYVSDARRHSEQNVSSEAADR
jgi:hypothetical protein